jgi:uncharacterized protein (TIGR00255 family)
MTGYGQASREDEQSKITVEVKTLNSKFLDISVRLPKILSEKEIEIRNLISEKLHRGKISVAIEYIHKSGADTLMNVNKDLFRMYYSELQRLAEEVDASKQDIFRMALQYPEVVIPNENPSEKEKEWAAVKSVLLEAIVKCNGFREREGKALGKKLKSYAERIRQQLETVPQYESQRVERIRERLKGNLKEFMGAEGVDLNRLEQEIIYYIEKIDINEEKVRLNTHLDHFVEILQSEETNGKKLNFISQEIGREINTIGSKANDADIQRLVINMKEELEKIKEQAMNVV